MKNLGNKDVMARNLQRLMSEKNVSAKEMSKTLGFPYTTVLSWLKGENYPRIDKIDMMAAYFGVIKSDLIEVESQEEIKEPATSDGLTDSQRKLIEFAKTVPEDKAAMILRVMQSIVASDE